MFSIHEEQKPQSPSELQVNVNNRLWACRPSHLLLPNFFAFYIMFYFICNIQKCSICVKVSDHSVFVLFSDICCVFLCTTEVRRVKTNSFFLFFESDKYCGIKTNFCTYLSFFLLFFLIQHSMASKCAGQDRSAPDTRFKIKIN